ncbi:MAG TPA: hypothetical protein VGD91_19135, partial [Trebonia sp.]
MLSISRQGARGRLLIVFRAEPGRAVPDGTGPSGAVGTVPNDTLPNDPVPNDPVPNDTLPNDPVPNGPGLGVWLNLHEPGAVRALLNEAMA